MILGLFITLIVLMIATWLYTVYLSWRTSENKAFPLVAKTPFVATWQQSTRLTRRGWYSVRVELKHARTWGSAHAQKLFIKVFPKSAPAFEKKDMLTGLTHGPSSYYLKSITPPKGLPALKASRLPRMKKQSIVAAPNDPVGTPSQDHVSPE